MAKVIRENKQLKRKKINRKNRALNNYNSWKNMQYGDGVKKNFLKQRIPTTLQKGVEMFHLLQVQYLFSTMEKYNIEVRKRFKMELDFLVLHNSYNVILEFVDCTKLCIVYIKQMK